MSDERKLFTAADWHFGHYKLVELGYRPPNFEDWLWQHYVVDSSMQSGDVLINCGDVAMYAQGLQSARNLLQALKIRGVTTVCTLGNHDTGSFTRMQRLGFDFACDRLQLTYMGKVLLFSHEPHTLLFPYEDYIDLNIHGHLHSLKSHRGDFMDDGRHALISSELCDYRPVPVEQVLRWGTPKWEGGRFRSAMDKEVVK